VSTTAPTSRTNNHLKTSMRGFYGVGSLASSLSSVIG
jgi:hypothetical protein